MPQAGRPARSARTWAELSRTALERSRVLDACALHDDEHSLGHQATQCFENLFENTPERVEQRFVRLSLFH